MQSGPFLWLSLLTIGVIALGLAMAYGSSRNRKRSSAEKILTDVATRKQALAEDKHPDES